jgi:hypothetical protein
VIEGEDVTEGPVVAEAPVVPEAHAALNNSLSSRLARLLVKADPSLAPLIETRALRSA